MNAWKLVVVFCVLAVVGFAVRNWQCEEMFPHSNRLACILWK